MQDLRTLSGTSSSGESINNVEQVTGQSFISSGASHAFLSVNGDMLHLNTLIDPALGVMLADAPGINDRGQIVANGFYHGTSDSYAYLLTPVPEPTTLKLFGVVFSGGLLLFVMGTRGVLIEPGLS
jgi:probable HAF family extracellular repeat protein